MPADPDPPGEECRPTESSNGSATAVAVEKVGAAPGSRVAGVRRSSLRRPLSPWTFAILGVAILALVLSSVAGSTLNPLETRSVTRGIGPDEVCVLCPYLDDECVPIADCKPTSSDCTSFTVSIVSAIVNAEGTSLSVDWTSNGDYPTTYVFGYGISGGTDTWVSMGSGVSDTVAVTEGKSYFIQVNATMTCSSGTVYKEHASETLSSAWTWTVAGVVDMATPSDVSKSTPIYGAGVYLEGFSGTQIVGSAGSYSFTETNSATSVVVCAEAPGYHENAAIASPTFAECDSVSVSGGSTTSHTLLLQLNSTLAQEPASVYLAVNSCFSGQTGCKGASGLQFTSVADDDMVSAQASAVVESSTSLTQLPPGCTSTSTCNLISFSGTTPPLLEAYDYWEILPVNYYGAGTTGIPLSSPMQLAYYVWVEGDNGHVAMDAQFSSGADLHSMTNSIGNHIEDEHGTWIAPSYQFLPQGQWVSVVVDLSLVTDQTLDYLSVGFDDGGIGLGAFQAYFADIRLEASQQQSDLANGDFMQDGLSGWTTGGSSLPQAEGFGDNVGSLDSALVGNTTGTLSAYETSSLSQEFEIPNVVSSDSVCLFYLPVSNDPSPGNGYQRIFLNDLTTGTDYYIVGTATSAAQNMGGWTQACLNIQNGENDIRGDRVVFTIETGQAGDGYVSYVYVTGITFTPDDVDLNDATASSSSNNYGYNGVDVSPLDTVDLTFPEPNFPTNTGVTYHVPVAGASAATATYQPGGSGGWTWTAALVAGLDIETLIRGSDDSNDVLAFSLGASAVVGHGAGTNQTCSEWTYKSGQQPCLFVYLVRLGIAFACVSGCTATDQGLAASSPLNDGDTAWNLAPICQSCSTSGDSDLELLDIFGIAAGAGAILAAAPFSGGQSLWLLPVLLGAASASISGASLFEDMQPITSGSTLPNSGLSCSPTTVAAVCQSYGWWDQNSTAGQADGGATMWGNVDSAYSGAQYDLAVIAQVQLGEVYTGTFGVTSLATDYAQVNTIYLVNVNTG